MKIIHDSPRPFTIFLVDDDSDEQAFFDIAWKKVDKSAELRFADDGISALKLFNNDFSFIPDVIFLDINMPIMNGTRLLKELKKIDRLNAVPIYMYSTAAEPRHIDECAALGAKGFIKKQGDIANLLESLTAIHQETRKKVS